MRTSVVVGVDGSPSATRAAGVAGELAARRGLPLDVMHVFSWPAIYPPFQPYAPVVQIDPRPLGRQIIAAAAGHVRERFPDLDVDTRLVDGNAAGALVDASRDAEFLVVGHRGLGGFAGLLVGSVGVHTTTHAHCPVLVVRGAVEQARAPVVVGVDGSVPARAATEIAFQEARLRGSELVVALAWPPARSWPAAIAAAGLPPHPDEVDPIEVSLGRIIDRYPDVKVRREVRHGDSPAQVLAELAVWEDAGLIVVGARGAGGFHGLLVGGTCRALVDHAPCPLMVIPAGRRQ
jgi:nucleotide-binding universal stress UspA family protein